MVINSRDKHDTPRQGCRLLKRGSFPFGGRSTAAVSEMAPCSGEETKGLVFSASSPDRRLVTCTQDTTARKTEIESATAPQECRIFKKEALESKPLFPGTGLSS
jgi:hypothetical protein